MSSPYHLSNLQDVQKECSRRGIALTSKTGKSHEMYQLTKALVDDDIKNREATQVFNHHNDPTGKKEHAQIQSEYQFDMDNHRAVQLSKIAYLQRKIKEDEKKIEVMEKVMAVCLILEGGR
ncbi:hypothetical protein ACEPPN_017566 [Leptodophora sp. 'Broadleaf-Isolate-01']